MYLRIQHTLQGDSGLSKDRFVNTFHGTTLINPVGAEFDAIRDAVVNFYNDPVDPGFEGGMSSFANGVGRTVKMYDLAEPEPRTPIYTWEDTATPWTNSINADLPSEVAVCLSYAGDPASGIPQARRRGRIYIGPLNVAWVQTPNTSDGVRPHPPLVAALLSAAWDLREALLDAGVIWAVYSPTNDTEGDGGPGSMTPITSIWCDDAFDTQRRRGNAPSTKLFAIG